MIIITHEFLQAMLQSDNWSKAEKCAVKWQYDFYGGFFKSLFECIARADSDNLARLAKGFPDEVQGFLLWTQGDLAETLEKASLEFEQARKAI